MNRQSQVMAIVLMMVAHLIKSMHSLPLSWEDGYHSIDRRAGYKSLSHRIIRSLRATNDEDPLNLGNLGISPSPASNEDSTAKAADIDYSYVDYSEIIDGIRSTGTKPSRAQQEVNHEQVFSSKLSSIKSSLYEDYEFDVTATDQVDDDDDVLRKYYGPQAHRRAALDDYDSFADFMQLTDADGFGDSPLSRKSQYGFLGDHSVDGSSFGTADSDYNEFENEW